MILFSFDIEEFDMPLEYGKTIDFNDQISISVAGTTSILDLLLKHDIKATFFSTVTFAKHAPELTSRIKDEGHELASHGVYHSCFEPHHLKQSKTELEQLSGLPVSGFRMPRMMPVDNLLIRDAGYNYNSSINPTWLPGRYNNLNISRTWFIQDDVIQLPASVSPLLRIPLFWLSFHNFPLSYYKYLLNSALKKDGYANIYFHPWEFTDLSDQQRFGFPGYVSKNSGLKMISRMDELMEWSKRKHYQSGTIISYLNSLKSDT